MPSYIIHTIGTATHVNGEPVPNFVGRGDSVGTAIGVRGEPFRVTASDRVEAFITAYQQLSSDGTQVVVAGVDARIPLGFDAEESARVCALGIPLDVELLPPVGAVMVERIEEVALDNVAGETGHG